MTKAVRGPITKINQSDHSIAGPIFSKYWTGYCPEWSRVVFHFQLKLNMADDRSFCQTLFLVLALKQARESCHIIQWGKPASVDCLTSIFPKTTWCSKASTKILSGNQSPSLSHQHQMSDALSGRNKSTTGRSSDINFDDSYDYVNFPPDFLKFRTLWPLSSTVQVTPQAHTLLKRLSWLTSLMLT